MAWSEYDHPLNQEMLETRSENGIERQIKEMEFRYQDNHEEIESYISSEYPSPSQSPDLPPATLAEIAGRELENNVSKIREFYTLFEGTEDINDGDYVRTLEYLGIRALRNGSG